MGQQDSAVPYPDRYTPDILRANHEQGEAAARTVVPLLLRVLPQVQSVIDVGCGLGTWAAQFLGLVAKGAHGVDGPWVPTGELVFPPLWFLRWDLRDPRWFWPPQEAAPWDLALCLEVAEHLPPECGPHLVDTLARLAPVVFWSAAVPGQGGWYHVNERPAAYWQGLFAERGYLPRELPGLAETGPEVHPWYRAARLYERHA